MLEHGLESKLWFELIINNERKQLRDVRTTGGFWAALRSILNHENG